MAEASFGSLLDRVDAVARDTDFYLCEASFTDAKENPPDLHLTGSQAGRSATDAGARRLVPTHIPPWNEADVALTEAKTTYDGPLELAVPGMTYEV